MKNLYAVFVLLLVSYLPLAAQVTYGVKAGVNAASVYSNKFKFQFGGSSPSENRLKAETLIRPQFGLWSNFPLSEHFSIRPELLYTSKALLPEDAEGAEPLYFDYLSLPILLNYQLGNWRLEAGPEISYLLRQYFKEEVGALGNKNPFIDENVIELAVNAGVRYHLQQWSLGLRYQMDYTPFVLFEFTDSSGSLIPNASIRQYHHGLHLSLGYSFVKQ